MPEDYGAEDYGEGPYGGELEPIITTDFIEYFPDIIPRENTSVIRRFIDSFGIAYDGYDAASRYVRNSRFLTEAQGSDLNRVGAIYGSLGQRGDRTRTEYRDYIGGIVDSFNARGTLSGVEFAVASAVNTTTDNVIITEDFVNNEYEIEISDIDTNFASATVNELAELAEPSGIELAAPPIITTTGDEIKVDRTSSQVVDSTQGLGAGTLTLDGNNTLQ
jgi:hypothetical protein